MADPFIAEIRLFGFNFAPTGWALCNGTLLPIIQNTALFSILGVTYGGNGTSTFALPNLQGVAPMQWGQGPGLSQVVIGEVGGSANVTLVTSKLPSHAHTAVAVGPGNVEVPDPANNAWGAGVKGHPGVYAASAGNNVAMNAAALTPAGGNQPHNNLQPYLVVNFCIALQGVFPPRV